MYDTLLLKLSVLVFTLIVKITWDWLHKRLLVLIKKACTLSDFFDLFVIVVIGERIKIIFFYLFL